LLVLLRRNTLAELDESELTELQEEKGERPLLFDVLILLLISQRWMLAPLLFATSSSLKNPPSSPLASSETAEGVPSAPPLGEER
jgi:hypothetical protein